jgi:hypothetical protein
MTLFWRGLKNIWSGAKNPKRSKKSQALRMTLFLRGLKNIWSRAKKPKGSKKSQALPMTKERATVP